MPGGNLDLTRGTKSSRNYLFKTKMKTVCCALYNICTKKRNKNKTAVVQSKMIPSDLHLLVSFPSLCMRQIWRHASGEQNIARVLESHFQDQLIKGCDFHLAHTLSSCLPTQMTAMLCAVQRSPCGRELRVNSSQQP